MPRKSKQIIIKKIPQDFIAGKIHSFRGKKVIMDQDLALLYGVETKHLTRQVRRNLERFPEDFMFQLTRHDYLRCQNGTSKKGGRRYLPYVFTEQGVAMLSSVLGSPQAIQANIQIMRTFVLLKRIGITYSTLNRKIDSLEKKYDERFKIVFEAIRSMMIQEIKPKRRMGFHTEE